MTDKPNLDPLDEVLAELQGQMVNVPATMKAKQAIVVLFLELIGADETIDGSSLANQIALSCNELRAELRAKVQELLK